MKSAKNYLIALLALTTIGGAWLAWRQANELAELRAAALNKDERADLQKRVWDLEKLNRELREQIAAAGAAGGEIAGGERPLREAGGRPGRGDPRREGFGPQFTAVERAMRDLMTKPEVQAMLNLQQQSAIDGRYAALFKNLNLPPDQIDRLKALLAERSTTVMDVMAAAREQGIDPRQNPEAFRKLVADAQNEINNSIKGLIGESGFAQLGNFEQTLPQRAVVDQLERRLSYTSTPLSSAQAEQLVQILASNPAPRPGPDGPPGRGPDLSGMLMGALGPGAAPMAEMIERAGGRGGSTTVTPAAVAQSQSILSPPQVQALQQIQQQQQSQQQLRQIVNDTITANQPPPPAGGKGGPGAGGPNAPPRKRPGGD